MHLPAFLLGLLLSTLYGTAVHFWRGGGFGQIVVYVLFSWVGFWLGHGLAASQGWNFLQLGPLQLGSATGGSAIFLLIGYWLSRQTHERKP